MPKHDPKDEEKRFAGYATGTLSANQREELATYLEAHPSAQDRLVDFIQDTNLFLEVGGELEMLQRSKSTFTVGELLTPQPREKSSKLLPALFAVAAILIATLGTVVYLSNQSNNSEPSPAIARIDQAPSQATDSDPLEGNWLHAGPIAVASGRLGLTLETGVKISITAPAEANLLSAQRIKLTSGFISAYTPPEAAGFTVTTPFGSVVDLGTAFTVNATMPKQITIHVTEGIVEFWPSNKQLPPQRISAGQAFIATANSIRPTTPPAIDALEQQPSSMIPQSLNYQHWSFDQKQGNRLPNSGPRSSNQFPMVLPKGHMPDLVDGPFGSALSFNGKSDYIVSNHPGINGPNPRTVAFWVKVPPNATRPDAHAMVAWGKPAGGNRDGEKWQIAWNADRNNGTIGAIRTEAGLGFVIGSTDLRDGRWHHVAIVLIGDESPNTATHIRQYIDGKLEAVSGMQARLVNTASGYETGSHPITLGKYIDAKTKFARVVIDELFVIDAALVPHEIQNLMTTNSIDKSNKSKP